MPSANKTSNGKGEFGGGPRGPRPPLLWFIKYFSITCSINYGIQTFAKFKRLESDSSPVVSTHLIIPLLKSPFQSSTPNTNNERRLGTSQVQNLLDCTSENFDLENFPGGACARNSIEKCAARSPHERFRAHIRDLQIQGIQGRGRLRVRDLT